MKREQILERSRREGLDERNSKFIWTLIIFPAACVWGCAFC